MKKYLMLTRVYIFTKRVLLSILFLSLVISSLFLVETISSSFIDYYTGVAKQLYGGFDNLLYYNQDLTVLDNQLTDIQEYVDYYGIISVLKKDGEIIVGQVDENAFELSGIYIVDGLFPIDDSEICLCKSIYYEKYCNNKLGDTISVNGRNYILSGIINDYPIVWNNCDDANNFEFPNALVFYSESNTSESSVILIKNIAAFPSHLYSDTSNLIANTNVVSMNKSNQYVIPNFIINIIRLMIFIVAFFVFLYITNKDIINLKILVNLGMKKHEVKCFIIIKNLIVSFVSSIVGCYVGRFISYVIIAIYNGIYSTDLVWVISTNEKINVIICLVIGSISFLVLLWYREKSRKSDRFIKLLNHKYSFNYEAFQNVKLIFIISFCVLVFVSVIVICNVYINMYSATLGEVWGRKKIDYDYQFTSSLGELDNYSYIDFDGSEVNILRLPNEDTVYYLPNSNSIIPIEVIHDIQTEESVEAVVNYYEANDVYLNISDVELDEEYVNGFPVDGSLSNVIVDNTCLESGRYRRVHFYTFPETELMNLDEYAIEGNIDINKIVAGEEIILIVPVYEIVDYGDGAWGLNFIDIDVNNSSNTVIMDDTFHVGDVISLCQIQPKNNQLMGYVSLNQIINDTIVNEKQFRIGAIIYERVMWFDDSSEMPTAYTFLGATDTLFNSGFIPTFSRTQIYLKDGINNDDVEPMISKYQNALYSFDFRNNIVEMEDYRQFLMLLKSICYTITILSFLIVFFTMFAEHYYLLKSQIQRYTLLRLIGVPPSFFVRKLIFNFITILLVSYGAFYGIGINSINYYFNDVNSVNLFFGDINLLILILLVNVLSMAINIIVYIPLFKKYPVFEH